VPLFLFSSPGQINILANSFIKNPHNSMTKVIFQLHPHAWRHPKWNRIQLRYFGEDCKIRREKNLEDFIITNGIKKIHLIKDNSILDTFLQSNKIEQVDSVHADAVIITDQQFSRLDVSVMLKKLNQLLDDCGLIYFCLNKYYLNANESEIDTSLPEEYDVAIPKWLSKHISNACVINLTKTFPEDGSWFTWVIPSCEILICRK